MKVIYRGFEELGRAMGKKAAGLRGELEKTTRRAVLYVHSTVPPYPEKVPFSRYDRQGTLGREIGTEVRPVGASFVGVIGSPTVYAPYVISDEAVGSRGPQTTFHKAHGWWTLQEVVRKAYPQVVEFYREMWHRWMTK